MQVDGIETPTPVNTSKNPANEQPIDTTPGFNYVDFPAESVTVLKPPGSESGSPGTINNETADTAAQVPVNIEQAAPENPTAPTQTKRSETTSPTQNDSGYSNDIPSTDQNNRGNSAVPQLQVSGPVSPFTQGDGPSAGGSRQDVSVTDSKSSSEHYKETFPTQDDRVVSYPAYGSVPRFPTAEDNDPNAYGTRTMWQTQPDPDSDFKTPKTIKGRTKPRSTSVVMDAQKVISPKPVLTTDDIRILDGLKKVRDKLYIDIPKETDPQKKERKEKLLLRLENFITWFEEYLKQVRKGEQKKTRKFTITYLALLEFVNPNNDKVYGVGQPFKNVDQYGNVTMGGIAQNHCNHFVYDVVEKSTFVRLFGERTMGRGMLGAGVYFEDNNVDNLGPIKDDGEMGDIVSFGPVDPIHPGVQDNSGTAHVGIYIGEGLYISATEGGETPFGLSADRVAIAEIHYHPHFREVK